jgi:hypothetical protein
MSNTGFLDVVTQPAGRGSVSVPDLGTFALLAGASVGPDGTVFLATLEGKVIALHPDGSPYWNRELFNASITSSPVVGSDGSVYVVGEYGLVRDHRHGETIPMTQAKLYRFTPGGGVPPNSITDFPPHDRGPTTIGAPNVWQFGNDEAIMVTALYPTVAGTEVTGTDLHLVAFSPNGGVMADWSLSLSVGAVTEGGSWDALLEKLTPFHFHPGIVGRGPPLPGVGIAANRQGGTPAVVLVDRYFRQTIRFMFCVGDCVPAPPGFTELFRTPHDPRRLWSTPMIMADTETVVGTDDGIVFNGPGPAPRPPITGLG